MAPAGLSALQTEARNSYTANIDTVSTTELCQIFNAQDAQVASAVAICLPSVARAIDEITERIRKGGRMISFGAGTSGRLGVLDASELPPTFHASPSQFIAIIAGGDAALRTSIEEAEDMPDVGAQDLLLQSPTPQDVVLGITSSGRTPYVLGALKRGREEGCLTVGIVCTRPSEIASAKTKDGCNICNIIIECITGAEIITGSTRLKAGSATKMILNMISTGVMIKLGRTFGNLMVDLKASNNKLQIRARNIVHSVCPEGIHTVTGAYIRTPSSSSADDERLAWDRAVDKLIESASGSVKLAILVARAGCGMAAGKRRLDDAGGLLAIALGEAVKNKEKGDRNQQFRGDHTMLEGDEPRLVLCIDGGGTRTVAAIAEEGGDILTRGEAEMSNFTSVGLNAALNAIKTATINALATVPSKFQKSSAVFPSRKPFFSRVWVGLAGVDRAPEFAVLLPALADLFSLSPYDGSISLTNDSFLLTSPIQSNLDTNEGVVLIAGTGSIAISYRTDGGDHLADARKLKGRLIQIRRSGGWGHLLGDEGSAFMTGRSAVRSVLTALDEGKELRPWHKEILKHFAAPSESELISCVVHMPEGTKDPQEAENVRKLRIASCARIVLRALESGDFVAQEVIRRAARDLIELIRPLIRSVLYPEGITPEKSTLCLGGGLMRQQSFWRLLIHEMTTVDLWEWSKVEVVEDAAVAGAKLLARKPIY